MQRLPYSKANKDIAQDNRSHHVRVVTAIGAVVGVLFSIFNLSTPGMLPLGLIELTAVLFLVVPAMAINRYPGGVGVSESLLIGAAMVIFGALIVFGGVESTGLFWVYTMPFLAFFLKGQRLGWLYSLGFMAISTFYLGWGAPQLSFAQQYSPVIVVHFLLSLGFYTMLAAAFDYVRTQSDGQLRQAKEQAEAANHELRQAKEKMEAALMAKSRFLAAASHDLRQPAHALGMFVSRLTQLPRDPATTEIVAGVNASVQALQEMLDVFFDYSRLDAQSTDVKRQPFAIDDVFDKLRLCFANSAAGKGLHLRIRPSSAWVLSDPVLLQRILLNLVSNALQYTPQGNILVSCRRVHGNTQARIEVWDSGIGIAMPNHEKVFEEFFQVENPERDRNKGLGLGLSMVQRACRLLNHPLMLRSGLGCGSRFSFLVPLAPTLSTLTSETPVDATPMGELAGLHVLLIEDDALGSRALQGLLVAWGCQVSVAGDAEMACELVHQGPSPDYVVSDYRLRGAHNGIDAIRLLRELSGQDIAACLISGDTEMDLRQKAQAAGLVLLQKPVPPAKLRSLLRRVVSANNSAS